MPSDETTQDVTQESTPDVSEQPAQESEGRDRGLHRHGEPDPERWDAQLEMAGRPAKKPSRNSTFAERAAGRHPTKAVEPEQVENKAVPSRRTRRKS